jgi:hypothetical protein
MPGSQSAAKDIVRTNRVLVGNLAVNEYDGYWDISECVGDAAFL